MKDLEISSFTFTVLNNLLCVVRALGLEICVIIARTRVSGRCLWTTSYVCLVLYWMVDLGKMTMQGLRTSNRATQYSVNGLVGEVLMLVSHLTQTRLGSG